MEARDRFRAVFMLSGQEIEGKDRGSEQKMPGGWCNERHVDRWTPCRRGLQLGFDEKEAGMRYEFYDGALDFIADLRRHGVKGAIVTSSNKKKMESLKKQVPDFDDLFDRVLTSEDFTASKPNPDC